MYTIENVFQEWKWGLAGGLKIQRRAQLVSGLSFCTIALCCRPFGVHLKVLQQFNCKHVSFFGDQESCIILLDSIKGHSVLLLIIIEL